MPIAMSSFNPTWVRLELRQYNESIYRRMHFQSHVGASGTSSSPSAATLCPNFQSHVGASGTWTLPAFGCSRRTFNPTWVRLERERDIAVLAHNILSIPRGCVWNPSRGTPTALLRAFNPTWVRLEPKRSSRKWQRSSFQSHVGASGTPGFSSSSYGKVLSIPRGCVWNLPAYPGYRAYIHRLQVQTSVDPQ